MTLSDTFSLFEKNEPPVSYRVSPCQGKDRPCLERVIPCHGGDPRFELARLCLVLSVSGRMDLYLH